MRLNIHLTDPQIVTLQYHLDSGLGQSIPRYQAKRKNQWKEEKKNKKEINKVVEKKQRMRQKGEGKIH